MATIKLKKHWEDPEPEEDDSSPLPNGEEVEEVPEEPEAQEEAELSDTSEEMPKEEPIPEPEYEPEAPKKDTTPIVRHVIPVNPDLAEELWGQPLLPEQRQRLEQDWQLGFCQLTDEERKFYGISDDPETYARMESLAKNYLKVSANQGKEDLIDLEKSAGKDGWGDGYLRDENGRFTERCVVELMNLRRRTREWVLPEEPDGSIDLTKYKRGDLSPKRNIRVKNERYGQRFEYWEALRDRARRWRLWREERNKSIPVIVVEGEAVFGELVVTPLTQSQQEENISLARQRVEQAEQLLCSVPLELQDPMWERVKPLWTQVGLNLRAEGFTHAYQVMKTGETENEPESTEPDGTEPTQQAD